LLKESLVSKYRSNMQIMESLQVQMLQNAKEHCFFTGLHDSGAELCKANIPYGIAKIHCLQQYLGMEPNAAFISTPDMTITRNAGRWKSGFSYGGKISWGKGDENLVVLDVKPNACGMLVGGLDELPPVEQVVQNLSCLAAEPMEIDGVPVMGDFNDGNHFIDLFELQPVDVGCAGLPPYAFVIHCSADELKGDNSRGFGLYYDESRSLHGMSEGLETPYGEIRYITGYNARKYYLQYCYAEFFSRQKRKLIADILFEDYREISDETHQGLINMNEIVLGCHHMRQSETLFPLTLRGDLPAYLVRGKPSLSPEAVETLGFERRARQLGIYDQLLCANVIPHGGGYTYPDILGVEKVTEIDGVRYFFIEMQNDRGQKIISQVQGLPFKYRGKTVMQRALEIGLMDIAAKMVPQYVLKI
jgi:hypothetical protein